MSESHPRTFSEDFRRFFVRGLAVLLPTVLTLWILVKAYQFVDNAIAQPINRGVRVAIKEASDVWGPMQTFFDPTVEELDARRSALARDARQNGDGAGAVPGRDDIRRTMRRNNVDAWWESHFPLELIGIAVAIIVVYIAGRLLGGYIGRRVYGRLETFFISIPVIKQVYPSVKQVVDFIFGDEQPIKFNRVVICEYPRKGIWSVGFMTGQSLRAIRTRTGDAVSVFIPSSPTPFTGYTVTVPIEDVVEVPITVDEALRFAVSGGVLVPRNQAVEGPGVVPAGFKDLPQVEAVLPPKAGDPGPDDPATGGPDEAAAPESRARTGPADDDARAAG